MSSIEDIETKRRFLDAAVALTSRDPVGEPAFGHLVSHVKLSDVARRLELSRAALYKLWPTQHDFWVDLATYVTTAIDDDPWIVSGIEGLFDQLAASTGDLTEATRCWFNSVERRLAADPRLVLRSASLGYPMPEDLVQHRTATERDERHRAATALERVLVATGLRPVPSLSVSDLTLALTMLVDGSAMFSWSAPDLADRSIEVDGEPGRPWSPLAYSARCVLEGLLEPGELRPGQGATPPAQSGGERHAVPLHGPAWTAAQLRVLRAGAAATTELIDGTSPPGDNGADALGHVGIDQVARAAGVTRRHLYNIWESQSDFRADLLTHLSERDFVDYFNDFDEAALDSILSITDPTEMALTISELVNDQALTEDRSRSATTFAFRPQLGDETLRGRAQRYLIIAIRRQAERLSLLGEVLHLDPAHYRVSNDDLATLLIAFAGGSERLNRIDPDRARVKHAYRGGEWSMMAIVCQCLLTESTGSARGPEYETPGLSSV